MDFVGTGQRLKPNDVDNAANTMRCETAVVWAVCDVESTGTGFLRDNRPVILYESYVFGRLTKFKWNSTHPNISSDHWDRNLYGAGGSHQYDRLSEAISLDRNSALESCSWGMFQILGLNHGQCGEKTVDSFISRILISEGEQLNLFVDFCIHGGLDSSLRTRNWTKFALLYNGPGYKSNNYDAKLAQAYRLRKRGFKYQRPGLVFAPESIGA